MALVRCRAPGVTSAISSALERPGSSSSRGTRPALLPPCWGISRGMRRWSGGPQPQSRFAAADSGLVRRQPPRTPTPRLTRGVTAARQQGWSQHSAGLCLPLCGHQSGRERLPFREQQSRKGCLPLPGQQRGVADVEGGGRWLRPLGSTRCGAGASGASTSGEHEQPSARGLRTEEGAGAAGDEEEQAGEEELELGSSISDFTRFYEDPARGVVALQTSTVTYWKQGPWWDILRPEVQVDLVSVVHIGDTQYYEELQEELVTYDRVLYEMVMERKRKLIMDEQARSTKSPFFSFRDRRRGSASVALFAADPGDGREDSDSETDSEADEDAGVVEEGEAVLGKGKAPAGSDNRLRSGSVLSGGRAYSAARMAGVRSPWRQPFRRLRRQGRRRGASIIGFIQRSMARALRLSFQLDHMDYQSSNFLNADLDLATFSRLQRERKESIFSLAKEVSVKSTKVVMATVGGAFQDPALQHMDPLRRILFWVSRSVPMPLVGLLLLDSVCRPPGTSSGIATQPAVQALLNLDVASAFKVFLAQQMSSDALDTASTVMEKSVIVGERNKAAMQELHRALDDGCRRIAIFYGSAHLPDLHRRLKNELGMRPVAVQWRTAWSILGERQLPGGQSGAAGTAFPEVASQHTGLKGRGVHKRTRRMAMDKAAWGGSPLTRSQVTALLIFSAVLAVDLWLWELLLQGVEDTAVQVVVVITNILDQGWSL